MLVDQAKIDNDIFFGNFIDGPREDGNGNYEPLPLANQVITGVGDFVSNRFMLYDCYPNPAKEKITIHFRTNHSGLVTVNLFDNQGRAARTLISQVYEPGEHRTVADISSLPAGLYIYQMKTGFYNETKKLVIVK
jgi:hypothetical protein